MEIKFQSKKIKSLVCCADRHLTQEQTQEVRLPDSMPDIGKVLACWGKPVIRTKEWQSGGMSVGGGVMCWIVYMPEDGTDLKTVETWIPFQMKWDFTQTQHDGYIFAVPALKSVDARSTSARKMIVRVNVSVWGRGMVPAETDCYCADDLPEDVQILKADYPMELRKDAGEVVVHMDEDIPFADIQPQPEKILRQDMHLTVTEQRVMASRLVFRGAGNLHLCYLSDGKVYSRDMELPFSQYVDLNGDYSQAATAQIVPIVTNFELERNENNLQVKCEMAAQYVIFDREMVCLAEDVYSNQRNVVLHNAKLQLSSLLDRRMESAQLEQSIPMEAERIADISCSCDLPKFQQNGQLMLACQVQILYYDMDGRLQSAIHRMEPILQLPADGDITVEGLIRSVDQPKVMLTGQQAEVTLKMELDTAAFAESGQWMVTGMELSEPEKNSKGRPSLILQRFQDHRLWDTAKSCGSTVDAIKLTNGLDEEPEKGRMLLIPIS